MIARSVLLVNGEYQTGNYLPNITDIANLFEYLLSRPGRQCVGAGMNKREQASNVLLGSLGVSLPIVGGAGVLILSVFLRSSSIIPDPLLCEELQFTSGIFSIIFAGAAFVRFQGTRERLPLILTASFLIVGVTLVGSSFSLPNLLPSDPTAGLRDPMTWVVGRTLLAVLLVSALAVERRSAHASNPNRELAAALVLVVLLATALSLSHRYMPAELVVLPGRFVPRPGNLVPAALFLLAAQLYHGRLKSNSAAFDWSLYLAAVVNFWCSIAAAESARRLDAAFALAAILQFGGYAVLIGGSFLDVVGLFNDIRRLAVTDSVTGLFNYRQLIHALDREIQRTNRTGRPFALLLFDLDGLKKINDRFGHQAGTRALCRAGEVMRSQCRTIDTAARHGGDEFAVVLPETAEQGAEEVLTRICQSVASDGEQPPISLSAGFAIYPRDAETLESLMRAADRPLYQMKEQHKRKPAVVRQAAG